MITAIDTSVLLDIVSGDPEDQKTSAMALRISVLAGSVVVCPLVYAEASARFSSAKAFDELLSMLEVSSDALSNPTSYLAGQIHREYKLGGGKKARVLPDFFIGAHALLQADRLLTRGRGFYREYFPKLKIIDPAKRLK